MSKLVATVLWTHGARYCCLRVMGIEGKAPEKEARTLAGFARESKVGWRGRREPATTSVARLRGWLHGLCSWRGRREPL